MPLIPREEKFYRFFRRQAELNAEAARLLCDAAGPEYGRAQELADRIRDLEHEGDAVIRDVFALLRKTFITPMDPEDIHRLAERQDDVLDEIEETAFRLAAYRLPEVPSSVSRIAELVRKACAELAAAVSGVEKGKEVDEHTAAVSLLEKEADTVARAAEIELFAAERDPIALLKKKELIGWMEATTDRCEDVAVVVENIVVKNA